MGRADIALCGNRPVRIAAIVAQSPVHPPMESGALDHYGGHHRVGRFADLVRIEPGLGAVAGIGITRVLSGRCSAACFPLGTTTGPCTLPDLTLVVG